MLEFAVFLVRKSGQSSVGESDDARLDWSDLIHNADISFRPWLPMCSTALKLMSSSYATCATEVSILLHDATVVIRYVASLDSPEEVRLSLVVFVLAVTLPSPFSRDKFFQCSHVC